MDPIITFPGLGDFALDFSSHFSLFGHTFYLYGVIIACGFLLALMYCNKICPEFGYTADSFLDYVLIGVPVGIICARAYYVFFYGTYHSFWDMCKIWEGGLAIYGGVIGAVLTVFVVSKVKKSKPLAMLDILSFGLLIGQSIGRWGNFTNREAYGADTKIFCRMGLTTASGTIYVHPCFLYESLWNAVGFLLMFLLKRKTERKFDGQYFLYYLGWYGLGRVWIEGLRADSLYVPGTGIRISQVVAGACVVVSAVILFIVFQKKSYAPEKLYVNMIKEQVENPQEEITVEITEEAESMTEEASDGKATARSEDNNEDEKIVN